MLKPFKAGELIIMNPFLTEEGSRATRVYGEMSEAEKNKKIEFKEDFYMDYATNKAYSIYDSVKWYKPYYPPLLFLSYGVIHYVSLERIGAPATMEVMFFFYEDKRRFVFLRDLRKLMVATENHV